MTALSQNGYIANDVDQTAVFTVLGSSIRLRLRRGDVATVLLYVARRFDDEVEDIDTAGTFKQDAAPSIPGGEPSALLDDWSYAERPVRGSTTVLSNHASGTAMDLNATQHPRGVRGTFTREQVAAVRRILAALVDPVTGRRVVRWGEDYQSAPVDGMHFEIDAEPKAVARVAAALAKEEDDMPTAKEIAEAMLDSRVELSEAAARHLNAINPARPGEAPKFRAFDPSKPNAPGSYVTVRFLQLWGSIGSQEAAAAAELTSEQYSSLADRMSAIEAKVDARPAV